jgi:hypothetical protein
VLRDSEACSTRSGEALLRSLPMIAGQSIIRRLSSRHVSPLFAFHEAEILVGRGGVEPPTSRLSGVRSNHLSYRPLPAEWLKAISMTVDHPWKRRSRQIPFRDRPPLPPSLTVAGSRRDASLVEPIGIEPMTC